MKNPGVCRYLPFALTTLRLLLGPLALAGALAHWPRLVFVPILIVGTLSDIYDGVLARRYGVATPALRRYDSATDLVYYIFILAALWRLCPAVLAANVPAITLILGLEGLVILVCYLKFGTYPATHTWLAKFYGLYLLFSLSALLAFAAGAWAIISLAVVALMANGEIIAMHLLAPVAPVDVRSILNLFSGRRQGKQ